MLVVMGLAAACAVGMLLAAALRRPPPPRCEPGTLRGFTPAELARYNGCRGAPVYIACKGIVYDADPEHYGPKAGYNAFVAKDASRHFGKMTVGEDEANQPWGDLSEKEMAILDDWEKKFRSKYPVVGWVVADWAPRPTDDPRPVPQSALPGWPAPVGPWPPPRPAAAAAPPVPTGPGTQLDAEQLLRQLAPQPAQELRALAQRRGIDLTGCTTKRDVLQAIVDLEFNRANRSAGGKPAAKPSRRTGPSRRK
eukprot:TRINITY_DN47567_c0_g1_i1.p1 TRINITY_DN47567_c0_g1~~TRINITY_DN47567_c0_g1_i1.p1  ORF type:complete len:292 (+),score=67.87 TRINITY_DN47567_c0_g1_i1:121-876(+)